MSNLVLREFVETDNQPKLGDGVIKDVLVLGINSRNRRRYKPDAMKRASLLYEGVAVFLDHPTNEDRERKGRAAEDRFGVLRGVHFQESNGGQLRGDLQYLTTHPMAPRVAEDLQRGLNFFGLSHLADGTGSTEKGTGITMVESIDRVIEVDLVTNPATALNLREQEEGQTVSPEAAGRMAEDQARQEQVSDEHEDIALENGVMAILKDPNLSTDKKLEKIKELFAAHMSVHEAEEAEAAADAAAVQTSEQTTTIQEPAPELKSLIEQVTALSKKFDETVSVLKTENLQLAEQIKAMKTRKHLPGGKQVELTEQQTQQITKGPAPDIYPESGTPAEQAAWLRRNPQ